MKKNFWIAAVLIAAILACSAPPTTPISSTSTVPIATPINEPVNCRLGPETGWAVTGSLALGQNATIIGRNETSSWWYVQTPNDPDTPCWVAASVTNTSGDLSGLAVIAGPVASVTSVSVQVDPQDISLTGCLGPVQSVEITGSISVNGPLSVQYRFETEQGGEMAAQTLEFETFGTQTIEIDFTPEPEEGAFWVRLMIIEPSGQTAETVYEIDCTP
jgi:hypothetical protein